MSSQEPLPTMAHPAQILVLSDWVMVGVYANQGRVKFQYKWIQH
jgi:hypothetical protein